MQIAYYEQYGTAGLRAFYETLRYAKEQGLVVITDAKRNDIGATASQYAAAFLGETNVGESTFSAFPSDFLTVNGYLGSDGITPFVEQCKNHDKGIFVLVKTSNPSSGELQNLKLEDGRTVYECMGDMVERWGEGTVGQVRLLLRRRRRGRDLSRRGQSAACKASSYLLPRARLRRAGRECRDAQKLLRCKRPRRRRQQLARVLCAYQKRGGTYDEAARAACLEMRADLQNVLGAICAK